MYIPEEIYTEVVIKKQYSGLFDALYIVSECQNIHNALDVY